MAKQKYRTLKLKINGFTPHTLPIGRLAEYLKEIAAILGTESDAHFIEVGDGSAELCHEVPVPKYPLARGRIVSAQRGDGPEEAVRGYMELRKKLRQDVPPTEAPAEFLDDNDKKIIQFPCPEDEPAGFGLVTQPGSLDGVLIKLGGRDDTVPVHLQDGSKYYKCTATRDIAKQLAPFLFAGSIRLHGTGRWQRTEDGEWELDNFRINSFDKLEDDRIPNVLGRMREVDSEWDKMTDPLGTLRRLRKGDGKVQ